MLEQIQEALENFIVMLGGTFHDDEAVDTNQTIIGMSQYIIGLLSSGKKATTNSEGYTPLMLYSNFGITDERFIAEIAKGKEYVTASVDLKNNEHPKTQITALTFAAASGQLEVLDKLYTTGHFSKQNCEEAVFFAALMGKSKVIAYFRDHQVDLFRPFFDHMTPLHGACANGHIGAVKEILASNPSDELISITTFITGETAYDYAFELGHTDCVNALARTKTAVWSNLINAIKNKDKKSLLELIDVKRTLDLSLGTDGRRYESLIGVAACLATVDTSASDIYETIEAYTSTLNVCDQINALIVGISYLHSNFQGENTSENIYLKRMMTKLNELRPHFDKLKKLSVNGLDQSQELWGIIKEILALDSVEEIEFVDSNPDVLDPITNDACTINLWGNLSIEFISCILANTSLIQCELYTDTAHKPIADLLSKVIERNVRITKTKYEILHDKIYNLYVTQINQLVREIKKDPDTSSTQCLSEISTRKTVHSLKQLTAFFVANHTTSQDASNNNNNQTNTLPHDCLELVSHCKKW